MMKGLPPGAVAARAWLCECFVGYYGAANLTVKNLEGAAGYSRGRGAITGRNAPSSAKAL